MNSPDIIKEISTCPKSPNCISTMTVSEEHKATAWPMTSDLKTTAAQLKQTILSMPRTQLVSESENSFHFVFTSRLMRFKDDVWFYLDAEKKQIHYKSASRVGYKDFGANKDRMNEIKSLLDQPR